jgi:hypothetical protein
VLWFSCCKTSSCGPVLVVCTILKLISGFKSWSFLFCFVLFLCGTGVWTQGLHLESYHQPFFCDFFKIGSHKLFAQAVSEPHSSNSSWVARITGMSHQHLAPSWSFLSAFHLIASAIPDPYCLDPLFHWGWMKFNDKFVILTFRLHLLVELFCKELSSINILVTLKGST